MALTVRDIESIKQALHPEFTKVRVEVIKVFIDELKKEMNSFEERIERRIQLSEKNIIETMGELHQDHEKRIQRIEKVIHIS